MSLPTELSGFTARPCTMEDAASVAAMLADCEEHEDGLRETVAADVEALWRRPGVDLAGSSVAVFEGERVAACGLVHERRSEIDVHPSARGRGLGSALLAWSWERARAQGATTVEQTVTDRRIDAPPLFLAHGYEREMVGWTLTIALAELAEPRVPEGYALEDLRYEDDARVVFDVIERAFAAFRSADEPGVSFEDWGAHVGGHAALAAWASPVARHGDEIVGAAIGFDYGPDEPGWVIDVAVDERHRGRGLGRALLETSFAAFRDRGHMTGSLSTNSRSGALTLYEHLGMHVSRSYTHWVKDLTAG
jgi:mycothiol synthase